MYLQAANALWANVTRHEFRTALTSRGWYLDYDARFPSRDVEPATVAVVTAELAAFGLGTVGATATAVYETMKSGAFVDRLIRGGASLELNI